MPIAPAWDTEAALAFKNAPEVSKMKKPRLGFRGPMGEQYIYDAAEREKTKRRARRTKVA